MDAIAIDPSVEMIGAICRQAAEDAELVAHVLDSIYSSKKRSDRQLVALTQEQLLGLGAAVRLARWEFNQIPNRLNAGLPSSKAVLQRIFSERPGKKLTAFVVDLQARMFQFYFQNFVWSASDCHLSIDLAIAGSDVEQLLNAVADFLVSQTQNN